MASAAAVASAAKPRYRVNTMTLCAKTDAGHVDLRAFFLRVADAVREGGGPAEHVSMLHEGVVWRVGTVTKLNGRPKTFGRQMFDNQATVVLRCPDGNTLNVKTFRNGNLQMTGARSVDSARVLSETVLAFMVPDDRAPPVMAPIRVCLMNADYKMERRVDRQMLYEAVLRAGLVCSYQPSIYPAVKTYYMWNPTRPGRGACPVACGGRGAACCKRVTVLVFYTGAIIITGATTHEHIDAAFNWVVEFINRTPGVLERVEEAPPPEPVAKKQKCA